MGGPGSGRKPGFKGKGVPYEANPVKQAGDPDAKNKELHHRVMQFGKALVSFDEPDYADAESMWQRFYDYLDLCDEWGIRPMVNSMAQAFCMNRNTLWGIATGNEHWKRWKGITPESVNVLQKAYDFLQTNLEISLMEEQKNPVKWFFLAKNYFGYEDQTVHVQRQEAEVTLLQSPEEVAAKYALQVGREQEPIEVEAEVIDAPNDSGAES